MRLEDLPELRQGVQVNILIKSTEENGSERAKIIDTGFYVGANRIGPEGLNQDVLYLSDQPMNGKSIRPDDFSKFTRHYVDLKGADEVQPVSQYN